MPLSVGKEALKNFLLSQAANTNEDQTPEQAAEAFVNALEAFVGTALITVPGTGLVAPPSGGPVTGASITGTLS